MVLTDVEEVSAQLPNNRLDKVQNMSTPTDSLASLRAALEMKQADLNNGLDNAVDIDGNNISVSPGDYAELKSTMGEITELKSLIQMHQSDDEVKSLIADLERPAGSSYAVDAAAAGEYSGYGHKSIGARFTESAEFKSLQASGRTTMDNPFELSGESDIAAGYSQKDVYGGSLTGATNPNGFGRVQFDPAVPRAQRATRVRDLFPVANTSANLIDYFRVLGFSSGTDKRGNAATVADYDKATSTFGLKPKSQLVFESAQAPVRTIAHWEAAHRNVINDEPQLQSTINNELLYGLALAEDDQILNGDGKGDNLLGILNTPGIQTYSQESHANDRMSDALRRAATLCVLANLPGTGFVLHPFDWEEIELQKATGDGQYMLVTNFAVGASTTIWRQPVVETPAMSQGEFLTGAFGLGAQLYDREAASIRIAEQHADFFVRNAVAILAEERLALANKRPEAFVKGAFKARPVTA